MDYYSLLGVTKDASQEEIKKAYKKMVMEHHPDRGGNHDHFAKINAAYETLKDPAKRAEYDNPQPQYNFNNANFNNGNFNTNFEDLFGAIFGRQQVRRNRDVKIAITLELEEVMNGKDLVANYTLFSGEQTIANIKIHPGVQHGEAIRFKGLGDNSVKQLPRGDLIVFVKVMQHKIFERDGKNLKIVKKVNVFDLITGTQIEIDTLNKNKIAVTIPKGTQPETVLSVSGYGLPDPNTNSTGNLYIRIKGVVPQINNNEIIERIKEINDAISIGS